MGKNVFNRYHHLKKKSIVALFLVFLVFNTFSLLFLINHNFLQHTNTEEIPNREEIKPSAIKGFINLTSYWIDENTYYHNSNFILEGDLNRSLEGENEEGFIVAIEINGDSDELYNDTTDIDGKFQINYTVSDALNIYSSHLIKAKVINGGFLCKNNFTIYANSTSYFEAPTPDMPFFTGETTTFTPNTLLKYDNGSGISNENIEYRWTNNTNSWPFYLISTNADGSLPSLTIPTNMTTGFYNLSLNFPTQSAIPTKSGIDGAEATIVDIPVFFNITYLWNIKNRTYEGASFTIRGQKKKKNDPTFKIYNRQVNFYYEGTLIGSDITDATGNFSFGYTIPAGTGLRTIRVKLRENDMDSTFTINVTTNPTSDPVIPGIPITSESLFLIIGVPIIITSSVIVAIAGYLLYRKKVLASRVINIPLEDKIKNLKLLKESGRIEEALSYLFSVIYMELISAKYGRKREYNETIRDFGIVSVKEFGLDPSKVYPFIQRVEQYIYSRPSQVSEEDFRKTIQLFSPVYYQLTGTNFILNF